MNERVEKRASPGIKEKMNESKLKRRYQQNLYQSNDKRCYRAMFQHELAEVRQLYFITSRRE